MGGQEEAAAFVAPKVDGDELPKVLQPYTEKQLFVSSSPWENLGCVGRLHPLVYEEVPKRCLDGGGLRQG